jgi:hypothetical protein
LASISIDAFCLLAYKSVRSTRISGFTLPFVEKGFGEIKVEQCNVIRNGYISIDTVL